MLEKRDIVILVFAAGKELKEAFPPGLPLLFQISKVPW